MNLKEFIEQKHEELCDLTIADYEKLLREAIEKIGQLEDDLEEAYRQFERYEDALADI